MAARDSGKVMVDAAFGELMVTCEKMMWLVHEGPPHIAPETRTSGRMVRTSRLKQSGGSSATPPSVRRPAPRTLATFIRSRQHARRQHARCQHTRRQHAPWAPSAFATNDP